MRKQMSGSTAALAVAAMLANAAPALAASPCGPGKVLECREVGKKPGVPPACRCVSTGSSSGSGSYGHAEVKKKNVPTVQPNKRSGRYD